MTPYKQLTYAVSHIAIFRLLILAYTPFTAMGGFWISAGSFATCRTRSARCRTLCPLAPFCKVTIH